MIPLYTLIALVAITSPEPPAELPACPRHTLQAVAVSLELLGEMDAKWYFVYPDNLHFDLGEMRSRYVELKNAPPLCDAVRLPSWEACGKAIRWNREYKCWLENRRLLFPREEWIGDAIAECDQLYQAWDYARDAQRDGYYSVFWRRRSMANLRELIGPQMYCAGCLPPAVPVWRMWRAD